jgi:hypothetical protein
MSTDIEELAREGMLRFTETMQVSPGLAARTCQRHRQRRRHTITSLAGAAAAVTAGAAVAATTLTGAGHQPAAELAAWTVAKHSNGEITVTIRAWQDPAGLQKRLRADGVPIVITPPANRSCKPIPAALKLLSPVVRLQRPGPLRAKPIVLHIHPAALPHGAGLVIAAPSATVHPLTPATAHLLTPARAPRAVPAVPALVPVPLKLVHLSPACTG